VKRSSDRRRKIKNLLRNLKWCVRIRKVKGKERKKMTDFVLEMRFNKESKSFSFNFYSEYLEEHTTYVPEESGKPKEREISYDDPHAAYSPMQLKAIATSDPTFLDGTKWLNL
jgi:hypothetical protein